MASQARQPGSKMPEGAHEDGLLPDDGTQEAPLVAPVRSWSMILAAEVEKDGLVRPLPPRLAASETAASWGLRGFRATRAPAPKPAWPL